MGHRPKKVRWSSRMWWYPRKLKDVFWWFRWRLDPNHRYHVVKTSLKPGYYDVDTRMLYCMMELLKHYVENECDGPKKLRERIAMLDEDGYHRHRDAEAEILAIYEWWLLEELRIDDEPFTTLEEDDKRYGVQSEMMKRLVDLRGTMWT